MKSRDTLDNVRRWWTAVHDCALEDLSGRLAASQIDGQTWRKSPGQLKDGSGLGIYPRLFVVRELLTPGDTFTPAYNKLFSAAGKRILPNRSDFVKRMSLTHSGDVSAKFQTPDVAEHIVGVIDASRSRDATPAAVARQLFTVPFVGPHALDEFRAWLGGTSMRRRDAYLSGADLPRLLPSPERDEQLAVLREKLTRPGSGIVVNVHQKGMWHGLSAVVREVSAYRADNRAILHIPLVSRSHGYAAPSFLQVLGYLKAFVDGEDVHNAPALASIDEIPLAIQQVRRGLAEQPAIIFLDGYSDPSIAFPELERTICDDHILSLVTRLAEPPLAHMQAETGLVDYRRNRIVLLSDGQFPSIPDDVKLPLPDSSMMMEVVKHQDLVNRDDVISIYKRCKAVRDTCSEDIIYAIDALVSIARLGGKDALADIKNRIRRALKGLPSRDVAMTAVSQLVLDLVQRERPDWYWLLLLIASTPGGIRPDTMHRLVLTSRRCMDRDYNHLQVLPDIQNPSQTIHDMRETCQAFLTDRRSDDFEGLADAHVAEFPTGIASKVALGGENCAIDFRIPELRRQLLASVSKRRTSKALHQVQSLHRLLAEEALIQQTIAFRHDPSSSSLRGLRRLLSVLFHGLMSIPIRRERFGQVMVRNVDFAIPADPQQAWEWLYLFAYRRLVEGGPPAWNLTRLFGADILKREILELIARPWKAWSRYPKAARYVRAAGDTLIPVETGDRRMARVALDYHHSAFQTAYALGELEDADRSLAATVLITGPSGAFLSHNKRRLDLALLRQDREEIASAEADFFHAIGSNASTVAAKYVEVVGEHLSMLVGKANFDGPVHIEKVAPVLDALKAAAFSRDWKVEELSRVSDIFFRLGERLALDGDGLYAALKVDALKDDVVFKAIREKRREAVIKTLATSMAHFRIAEALRLQVFSDYPTSDRFFASGHSARQMTRVALKLERLSREGVTDNDPMLPGFFARKARQYADVVTRHLHKHPRERAGMLILESAMARLLPGRVERDGVLSARSYLQQAEPVVLSLGSPSRVKMRFLLERAKVHRRMALLKGMSAKEVLTYLEFAETDLNALRVLLEGKIALWGDLCWIQETTLARVRSDLAKSSQSGARDHLPEDRTVAT